MKPRGSGNLVPVILVYPQEREKRNLRFAKFCSVPLFICKDKEKGENRKVPKDMTKLVITFI